MPPQGNIAGAAAPAATHIGPIVDKHGFHVSRYESTPMSPEKTKKHSPDVPFFSHGRSASGSSAPPSNASSGNNSPEFPRSGTTTPDGLGSKKPTFSLNLKDLVSPPELGRNPSADVVFRRLLWVIVIRGPRHAIPPRRSTSTTLGTTERRPRRSARAASGTKKSVGVARPGRRRKEMRCEFLFPYISRSRSSARRPRRVVDGSGRTPGCMDSC